MKLDQIKTFSKAEGKGADAGRSKQESRDIPGDNEFCIQRQELPGGYGNGDRKGYGMPGRRDHGSRIGKRRTESEITREEGGI